MVARQATVQWNEGKQRWMAWLRFPDGSRRKVERVDKPDAEADLKDLLAERAGAQAPVPRRDRLASFDDLIDAWVAAGAPRPPTDKRSRHAKKKSENTIITIGYCHARANVSGPIPGGRLCKSRPVHAPFCRASVSRTRRTRALVVGEGRRETLRKVHEG